MFTKYSLVAAVIVLFSGFCYAQQSFASGVQLTTIDAPWAMRINGQELDLTGVQAKPDRRSAYFMMVSEKTKLNVSVFIEPVGKCKTNEECRDFVLESGNPKWGKIQQLEKSRQGEFSYFEFFRPEVDGQPVGVQDLYAEYVAQGYWVDLHISKVQYKPEDHKLFDDVLRSVVFLPKPVASISALDVQMAAGQKSAWSFLNVIDTGDCRGSYALMSSISKKDLTEKAWTDYCTDLTGFLGKKTSRAPIAFAFTGSLPPKTDRPLAVLAYHTNFQKRDSVVEIVALMQETSGSWVATNYLVQ